MMVALFCGVIGRGRLSGWGETTADRLLVDLPGSNANEIRFEDKEIASVRVASSRSYRLEEICRAQESPLWEPASDHQAAFRVACVQGPSFGAMIIQDRP